jgi:hypothetical protein
VICRGRVWQSSALVRTTALAGRKERGRTGTSPMTMPALYAIRPAGIVKRESESSSPASASAASSPFSFPAFSAPASHAHLPLSQPRDSVQHPRVYQFADADPPMASWPSHSTPAMDLSLHHALSFDDEYDDITDLPDLPLVSSKLSSADKAVRRRSSKGTPLSLFVTSPSLTLYHLQPVINAASQSASASERLLMNPARAASCSVPVSPTSSVSLAFHNRSLNSLYVPRPLPQTRSSQGLYRCYRGSPTSDRGSPRHYPLVRRRPGTHAFTGSQSGKSFPTTQVPSPGFAI